MEHFDLHLGEEQAIALALELKASVLIDEKEARQVARNKGRLAIGTLGLLERAAEMKLLDITIALAALRQTNAHISDTILAAVLRRFDQQKT